MNLGEYELLAQIDAGQDAVVYRGTAPPSSGGERYPVEIRVLSGAQSDTVRWPALCKRLRQAAMLRHPVVVPIRKVRLDQDPPFVVLDEKERRSLVAACQNAQRLPLPKSLQFAKDIASALAEAHRVGLVHGRLSPNTIHVASSGGPLVDFAGTNQPLAANHANGEAEKLDLSCQAPELLGREMIAAGDFPADVYGLGAVLFWLLTRTPAPLPSRDGDAPGSIVNVRSQLSAVSGQSTTDTAVERLLVDCQAAEPADRPSASDVEHRLVAILAELSGTAASPPNEADTGRPRKAALTENMDLAQTFDSRGLVVSLPVAFTEGATRDRLGRFLILEKLGQGAMGTVYRAQDSTDESIVAIKVLRPHLLNDPQSLRRFRKEARILAQLSSPYIANLLEANEDNGIHYLVMEFVTGDNLATVLDKSGPMQETAAVNIVADVARGLVDAHERGIVHRDIKPGNIWLTNSRDLSRSAGPQTVNVSSRAKLLDFGLARHLVETESLQMTQAGVTVGTPMYMAPEQGLGKGVDTRSDVYSMGATLFHLVTGRPPFDTGDPLLGPIALILKHAKEPLPSPKKINPALSDAVCHVLEKALAKAPDARYADAGALLRDLERILRGEPTEIALHPKLPVSDPRRVFQFDWGWDLQASPAQLWPYVSNTERLNRAATIPPVNYSTEPNPLGGVRLFGQFRKAGFNNVWEEHPFEWVEGRRMGVLRVYSQGVFRWLMTSTELEPLPEGGTRLTHRVRIEPRNLIGRLVARIEVGMRGRNAVEKVYRRIDAALMGQLGSPATTDPFEAPVPLSAGRRQRLDDLLRELARQGVSPAITEALGQFIADAPPQEVARIRPIALARRLNLDVDQFVAACLRAAHSGLLVLMWDLLCPVCRIPSGVKETLKALEDHGRCDVCNLDFPIDFARSVELIFRAHPEVRASELATYCLGGPHHSPHVAAQVRLAPGERMELPLDLPAGSYVIRGPQLPFAVDFRVNAGATSRRLEVNLRPGIPGPSSSGEGSVAPQSLRTGGQLLCLNNEHPQELVVRFERTAARADALTAARASSLALFRDLFPGEVLTAGQLISVATVTLLATDLRDVGQLYQEMGESAAFGLIHEHFRVLEEHIRHEGGALVKTMDERLLAAFDDPVAAVQAAWQFPSLLAKRPSTRALQLRIGIHRGPALVATFNDHLDYFGGTVKIALQLPHLAEKGEAVLSQSVASDPRVAAWLHSQGLQLRASTVELFGGPGNVFHLPTAS